MSLHNIMPWLLVCLLLSTLGMVYGVSQDQRNLAIVSAGAFALFMVVAALRTNAPYWRRAQAALGDDGSAVAARRNARLMATCYNWGAIALLAIYTLTPLRWQHGWQYALAMVFLGLVCFGFALWIRRAAADRRAYVLGIAAMLTAAQGILAALALFYLIGWSKLPTLGADWPANYVFLFGAISLTALSACALRTHYSFKA